MSCEPVPSGAVQTRYNRQDQCVGNGAQGHWLSGRFNRGKPPACDATGLVNSIIDRSDSALLSSDWCSIAFICLRPPRTFVTPKGNLLVYTTMHLSSIKAGLGLRPTALLLTALCLALPLLACQKADPTIDPLEPTDPPVRQSASFTVNGRLNEVNGDCVSGCIRGEFDGQFTLTITAPGRQTLQLRIRGFAGQTGSFPFTADDAVIDYSTGPANPTYATGYVNCQSPYNAVDPSGTLQITKVADKPGDYVEGTFATVIHPRGECGRGGLPIKGSFRVQRER